MKEDPEADHTTERPSQERDDDETGGELQEWEDRDGDSYSKSTHKCGK